MKNKRYLYVGLTVISCVLMITLGWVYLVYGGTTIGANISTVDISAASTTLTNALNVAGLATLDALKFTGASTTLDAASTGASTHITASQVCDYTVLYPNAKNAANYYTPTAAALRADCLTSEGAFKEVYLLNNGTAASSVTIVASTSIEIEYPTSTNASTVINGGDHAILRFERVTNNVVKVFISFFY